MSSFKDSGLVGSIGRVLTLLSLSVLALASGCYWSRYREVMELHLEILEEFTRKLEHLAEDGEQVSPQDWGEFVYPLARARDFARIARKRFPERRSLALFGQALDRYGDLVSSPDLLDGPGALERIRTQAARLGAAIASVRRALAAEDEP